MHTCPLTLTVADHAKHVAYQMARPAQAAVETYNPSSIQEVAEWVQANLPVILTCSHFPYTLESKRTYLKYYYKFLNKVKGLLPPVVGRTFLVRGEKFVFDPVLAFGMTLDGNFNKRLPLQGEMYFCDAVGLVVCFSKHHLDCTNLTVYMIEHPKHQVLLTRERLYL